MIFLSGFLLLHVIDRIVLYESSGNSGVSDKLSANYFFGKKGYIRIMPYIAAGR